METTNNAYKVKMESSKATLETLVKEYNDLKKADGTSQKQLSEADEKIIKCLGEYADFAELDCFSECLSAENPMIHAVKKLEYTVLAVKDEAVGGKDSGVTNRVIQDKTKAIDFKKLHDRAPHGIGANVNWWHIVEKFNCLLTAKVAEDLGIDPKSVNDSFAMDKISRDIDLGKNPTSNSNMLKTLQLVINAMVGEEYKCTSHDLKYIMHTFGKKSRKALTVTASNHKQLRTIMAEICHKIIMGKVYDLDYKKIK